MKKIAYLKQIWISKPDWNNLERFLGRIILPLPLQAERNWGMRSKALPQF